jgi:hypothetical protein
MQNPNSERPHKTIIVQVRPSVRPSVRSIDVQRKQGHGRRDYFLVIRLLLFMETPHATDGKFFALGKILQILIWIFDARHPKNINGHSF